VLNWTNGEAADKFFEVAILDNGAFGGDTFFSAGLSGVGGASLGHPSLATITIADDEPAPPPPPELLITNPPGSAVVSSNIAAYDLQGVANPAHWIGLVWTNPLTGQSGLALVSNSWTIAGVPLGIGTNVITVSATNLGSAGVLAWDSATNSAYNNGWTNGSDGGAGWGAAWSLAGGASSGHFLSDETNDLNNSVGPRAWGLYANSGQAADAWRDLADNLAVGRTLSLRFDNTGIPWSDAGWLIAFRLTNSTQYRFTCGTNVVTGALKAMADQNIARFHAWNFNAGPNVEYNYYFNDLAVTGGVGGAGVSTSATATIIRQAEAYHDGIPQSWWDRYGLGTNSSAGGNNDGDLADNGEEYVADTDPTDPASVFSNRILSADGASVLTLQAGPPTTNSRIYDVWFGTDLVEGVWIPLNINRPGAADGAALFLTVTNTGGSGNYRTGVKLP
jgi:hypothetical protein